MNLGNLISHEKFDFLALKHFPLNCAGNFFPRSMQYPLNCAGNFFPLSVQYPLTCAGNFFSRSNEKKKFPGLMQYPLTYAGNNWFARSNAVSAELCR